MTFMLLLKLFTRGFKCIIILEFMCRPARTSHVPSAKELLNQAAKEDNPVLDCAQ